jgi:hypothetical protein
MRDLHLLNWPNNYYWCLFLLGFYGIELFIPLQILFYFQFKCNNERDQQQQQQQINTVTTCDCNQNPQTSEISEDASLKASFLPHNSAHTIQHQKSTQLRTASFDSHHA